MKKKLMIFFSMIGFIACSWWGCKVLNPSLKRFPAQDSDSDIYHQADFILSQEDLHDSKSILKWIHKDANVAWESFDYPAGRQDGNTLKVCFCKDTDGHSRIGKVWDGACLYGIQNMGVAIKGIDNEHKSLRKRYHWDENFTDYYILIAESSEDYKWIPSNKMKNVSNDYKQLVVDGLSPCLAENLTANTFIRKKRGWHPGEIHHSPFFKKRLRCYYEYGSRGDKSPTVHSVWSRQQVKVLYVKQGLD